MKRRSAGPVADVVVVGSGMAGLSFALGLPRDLRIVVVTKKERAASSTNWAQGGIASVQGEDDRPELHLHDTLLAGAGLCHRPAVETLVREGPLQVAALMEWGAPFDRTDAGTLYLGMEGGHSRRRIARSADRTGREIEQTLLDAVAGAEHIEVWEDHLALDLMVRGRGGTRRCAGIRVVDHAGSEILEIRAPVTMLATGGCGQVYRHTTNPGIATGDGIAIAYRAGAHVANLEFIQFHPTALHPTGDPAFLISEALRGEGAVLRTLAGERFMDAVHPSGSLAPRDVVARAIDAVLKDTGESHVLLDVSAFGPGVMESHFPTALEACRARNVDPAEGIPVVPAAHYVCGGIVTDTDAQTTLPGLYAAGEVACTGVPGATRLASNSLLEAVVFAARAARVVGSSGREPTRSLDSAADAGPAPKPGAEDPDEDALRRHRRRLRELMWEKVGIVRSRDRLAEAQSRLAVLAQEDGRRWSTTRWTVEGAELRNLLLVARLIVRSALLRRESRGLHFTVDHPWRDSERQLRDTILRRVDAP